MTHGSECDISTSIVIFPCHTNDGVSYVLLYDQLQEFWIMSGLQWRNVNEYHLPSKNAHSPNYCSWLAVCVNYSAKFYCKIALINTFKLYLIKTYSKTPKTKKTKRKQKQRRIHLTFAFSERHVTSPGWHYNVTRVGWHYNVTLGDHEAVNIW